MSTTEKVIAFLLVIILVQHMTIIFQPSKDCEATKAKLDEAEQAGVLRGVKTYQKLHFGSE